MSNLKRFGCAVGAAACVCLLWTDVARGQETTGALNGRVIDAQSLPVPGATVTITGPQGTRTMTTDADGRFAVASLTPGHYDVRVELQGFKTTLQKDVAVILGQTVSVPVTLVVGPLTETVQVTASVPVIDTRTTTSGATLSSDFLQQVPVGRTLASTIYLAPGVSSSDTAGSTTPSIAGG